MPRLRIETAKAKCRSFGKCMNVAPEVFAFDADRKVSVIDPAGAPVSQAALDDAYAAVRSAYAGKADLVLSAEKGR